MRGATPGVPFRARRVALVGTLPAHRRRELIRRRLAGAYPWCAALGHPVQVITGIAHSYRRFGYEQGLPLGAGPAISIWRIRAIARSGNPGG
jgi:hypothetical protein